MGIFSEVEDLGDFKNTKELEMCQNDVDRHPPFPMPVCVPKKQSDVIKILPEEQICNPSTTISLKALSLHSIIWAFLWSGVVSFFIFLFIPMWTPIHPAVQWSVEVISLILGYWIGNYSNCKRYPREYAQDMEMYDGLVYRPDMSLRKQIESEHRKGIYHPQTGFKKDHATGLWQDPESGILYNEEEMWESF